MDEKLDRHEIPVQHVKEKDEYVQVSVPIHLEVMRLPRERRLDISLLDGSREAVKAAYDKDMEYHIGSLEPDGRYAGELERLMGFETFQPNWDLRGELDTDFLNLWCRTGGKIYKISLWPGPLVFQNQRDHTGDFSAWETYRRDGSNEIVYRELLSQPEFYFMPPEKLRRYGMERTVQGRNVFEVSGHAFRSGCLANFPEAILLRDYAVFYLNRLLDAAKKSKH